MSTVSANQRIPKNRNITIRQVVPNDLPSIQSIANHYIATSAINLSHSGIALSDWEKLLADIQAEDHPFIVASSVDSDSTTNHEHILGYAYAHRFRPKDGYRHTLEISLYLAHDQQKQGIGRVLLEKIVQVCQKHPIALQLVSIITDLGGEDSTPSIRLHRKLGFEQAGRLCKVGYKFNQFYDIVLMQRSVA